MSAVSAFLGNLSSFQNAAFQPGHSISASALPEVLKEEKSLIFSLPCLRIARHREGAGVRCFSLWTMSPGMRAGWNGLPTTLEVSSLAVASPGAVFQRWGFQRWLWEVNFQHVASIQIALRGKPSKINLVKNAFLFLPLTVFSLLVFDGVVHLEVSKSFRSCHSLHEEETKWSAKATLLQGNMARECPHLLLWLLGSLRQRLGQQMCACRRV